MKKILYSILAISVIGFTSCGESTEDTKKDESHKEETKEEVKIETVSGTFHTAEGAKITWRAKHLGDADFVHIGTVPATGSAIIEDNIIIGGNFSFAIAQLDEDGDGDMKVKLEKHLQEPGFFDAITFPTATFSITSVESDKIHGEMEILGIKKEITLNLTSHVDDGKVHVSGATMLNFLDFGMANLVIPEDATEEEKMQSPDANVSIEFDFLLEVAK